MPTPSPAWNLVPRWRTITLPPATVSPPNSFTPSILGLESRPLREEPPAFLCAMTYSLARRDAEHLHRGEVLTMTALAMGVLAALLLEGDDLLALAVVDDFALDGRALDQRRADLGGVATQHQDFQVQLGADVADEAFDLQDRVLGHLILFSAGADDRVHWPKSLKIQVFPER